MQDLKELANWIESNHKHHENNQSATVNNFVLLAIAERLDGILTVLQDVTSPLGKHNIRLKIWNRQA